MHVRATTPERSLHWYDGACSGLARLETGLAACFGNVGRQRIIQKDVSLWYGMLGSYMDGCVTSTGRFQTGGQGISVGSGLRQMLCTPVESVLIEGCMLQPAVGSEQWAKEKCRCRRRNALIGRHCDGVSEGT
jgi:hypothetical protein